MMELPPAFLAQDTPAWGQWVVAAGALMAAAVAGWLRERTLARRAEAARLLYALGEELSGADSAIEILHRLQTAQLHPAPSFSLYVKLRGGRGFEYVSAELRSRSFTLPLESATGPHAVAGVCYRNRTILAITDISKSPIFSGDDVHAPGAALLVPMISQGEVMGVLRLDYAGPRPSFSREEQAAAQHLAGHAASLLKAIEHKAVEERTARSERLAAVGQMISGMAQELRAPLESITARAGELAAPLAESPSAQGDAIREIAADGRRLLSLLEQFSALCDAEGASAEPVDLNALTRELLELRQLELRQSYGRPRQVNIAARLAAGGVPVLAARGQLHAVVMALLAYGERAAAASADRTLQLSTSVLAGRALLELRFGERAGAAAASAASPAPLSSPAEGDFGLGLCRGVLQSHGGDLALSSGAGGATLLEASLPLAPDDSGESEGSAGPPAAPVRRLTALLVEPDPSSRKRLVVLLSERGHRTVPVGNAEEAADLADRLRFDLVFCSVRLPGTSWVELLDRIRPRTGAFILLCDAYDSDLARLLPPQDGAILQRPADSAGLDEVLARVAPLLDRPPSSSGA